MCDQLLIPVSSPAVTYMQLPHTGSLEKLSASYLKSICSHTHQDIRVNFVGMDRARHPGQGSPSGETIAVLEAFLAAISVTLVSN